MATKGMYKEKTDTKIKEPKRYHVIMHNDDFTTMDFVVEVLEVVFHKNGEEAERLMMLVHKSGKAIIGTYSLDIATTKVNKATNMAKEAGFPFKLTINEA